MLAVRDLRAGYGSAPVLRNMSFGMAPGEILGIVGHNGMGKTTLLRVLMGLLRVADGSIAFEGRAIETWPAHRRSRCGIGHAPQGGLGFPALSVAESLRLAAAAPTDRPGWSKADMVAMFPRLEELMSRRSAALSGGERRLLAIAQAAIRAPRLLLLDEPTEGVQPSTVAEMMESLRVMHRQTGMNVLLVDQDLAFVASLASRVLVMQKGEIVKELAPGALNDPAVLGGLDAL